jgi:Ca-activated chloride channel family protein
VIVLSLALLSAGSVQATGRLIPTDKTLPPLAMTSHQVNVTIDEQVAVTHIEQTFHNHTNRQLEATYYLPVPKGANVKRFSMWVNGIEVPGELVEADKARKIYTDIVQRTLDPGLLEYMNNSLLKMRIFPIPPNGEQKITLSYTSVNPSESNLIEYVYPMRSENKNFVNQDKFSLNVTLKSQFAIQNIYSPSHSITMTRANDNQATIGFAKEQAVIDRDFQLFYNISTKDIGLNTLTHRPIVGQDGYFMLLVSPRAELSKSQQIPRDMVFVLDTSGSMRGKRMTQARNALKYCLENLTPDDRFGLMNFATTVNKYTDNLLPATKENLLAARKWVEKLEATGGTAIDDAMSTALAMRTRDETRPFNIVFFTDGRPTIGETDSEKILKNVSGKNTANTRIFTFGVGDDVNATMLDAMAENSRAIATYVRETEDIEAKTTGLYAKISNPVLSNLKLSVDGKVKLNEVYPPQLPDLFHGTQLVVLGRYNGKGGKTTVTLTGMVGKEKKEFTYEVTFPERSTEEKPFVEDLWARRKVGYLLDQIRANGEKKELVEEVVNLAKRYGITTPYTSYLVVPDGPVPVARPFNGAKGGFGAPLALQGGGPAAEPRTVNELVKEIAAADAKDKTGEARAKFEEKNLAKLADDAKKDSALPDAAAKADPAKLKKAQEQWGSLPALEQEKVVADLTKDLAPDQQQALQNYFRNLSAKNSIENAQKSMTQNSAAMAALANRDLDRVQAGALGVDLSVQSNNLRNQSCVTRTASKYVQNRNCVDIGGVWVDDSFSAKTPTVAVKAMSNAYFRILEKQPEVREVFQLGNHLVWVTPSGTALIIDQNDGLSDMPDADITRLFTAAVKK